jgi:hypothetical protein
METTSSELTISIPTRCLHTDTQDRPESVGGEDEDAAAGAVDVDVDPQGRFGGDDGGRFRLPFPIAAKTSAKTDTKTTAPMGKGLGDWANTEPALTRHGSGSGTPLEREESRDAAQHRDRNKPGILRNGARFPGLAWSPLTQDSRKSTMRAVQSPNTAASSVPEPENFAEENCDAEADDDHDNDALALFALLVGLPGAVGLDPVTGEFSVASRK